MLISIEITKAHAEAIARTVTADINGEGYNEEDHLARESFHLNLLFTLCTDYNMRSSHIDTAINAARNHFSRSLRDRRLPKSKRTNGARKS